MWRAGFGPSKSDRVTWSKRGLGPAIDSLMRPPRQQLAGRQMLVQEGDEAPFPINVANEGEDNWAHEVLWWVDRMVRTRAPLVERMTLNLHDHFATSNHKVDNRQDMITQNHLLRRYALGSFEELARALTRDHAMQQWLDLANSDIEQPNENYAREFMELFTIGTEHTQQDVLDMARAFTGFRFDWETKRYWFDPEQHDAGMKTILGKRGRWGADDAIRICLEHPAHAPFLCRKIWSYFVPRPPSNARLQMLTSNYVASGWNLGVLVRTILHSPELYSRLEEPDMIKPPVVHMVGLLRTLRPKYLPGSLRWELDQTGQQIFFPPHVAGWDQGEAFLSSGTMKGRFGAVGSVLWTRPIEDGSIPATETARQALEFAREQVGRPWESPATSALLERVAARYTAQGDEDDHFAAERRLVLRHLLAAGPDACVH